MAALSMSQAPSGVLKPSPTARHSVRRAMAAYLAAFILLFALDALLFRTSLYTPWLEPDSSTGLFENTFRRELKGQAENGDNLIVTLGDSRFGYLPRLANELTQQSGYVFRNAGEAGTDPRSWYYMLRDLDPTASRYRAVVFGVDDFDDEDTYEDHSADIRPLHFVIVRLRLADTLEFARSFPTWSQRWEAFRGGLFKGFVLAKDIQAFLLEYRKRVADVRLYNGGWADWTYNYNEDPRSLAGLQVDWAAWKASFPPGADQIQRNTVNTTLLRPVAPQTGRYANFRRLWYGRMLDLYRGSRTKIIFIRLARGPVLRPDSLVHKKSASIREFASRPNVFLANEHAFDSLERPELFKDAVHLNREGCARFSRLLVEEVGRILKQ
jgi:hypothetical protein